MAKQETQTIECRIIRKTSKYNKYIKWFAECYYPDGSLLSSFGYRTRKKAEASLQPTQGIVIGNRTVKTVYKQIA